MSTRSKHYLKKKGILILCLCTLLPIGSKASWGYSYKNLSFSFGGIYNEHYGISNSYEISYLVANRNCLDKRYFGLAANMHTNKGFSEYGLEVFFNPTRLVFPVSRNKIVFPYISLEQTFRNQDVENQSGQVISSIPGIGLHGIWSIDGPFIVSPGIQFGYRLNDPNLASNQRYTVEFKVGIGLNTRFMKKRSDSDD